MTFAVIGLCDSGADHQPMSTRSALNTATSTTNATPPTMPNCTTSRSKRPARDATKDTEHLTTAEQGLPAAYGGRDWPQPIGTRWIPFAT